jgi:hypothetical protein
MRVIIEIDGGVGGLGGAELLAIVERSARAAIEYALMEAARRKAAPGVEEALRDTIRVKLEEGSKGDGSRE